MGKCYIDRPDPATKAERILNRIRDRVGGEVRISKRGVPHLAVSGVGGMSACYFTKTKIVRVFTNYMTTEEQERFDFKEWPQAATFIEERMK